MESVEIRVLGRFEVWRGGQRVAIRSRKARALLAYLALPARKRHAREALAALLWGDMDDDHARQNLRQCVSTLRRALGERVIVGDGGALCLGPDVLVDAAALDRGEVPEAYQGLLLDGLHVREDPFDAWLDAERLRMRQRASEALEAPLAGCERSGDLHAATVWARRRLEIDPACEQTHRRLMQLYDAIGRRSDALEQYEACSQALRRDHDARPSVETEQLYARLRQADCAAGAEPESAIGEAPSSDRPAIAVLPFSTHGGSPETEYLGLGIAEELTLGLSRFGSLLVIAATAMRAYHRTSMDVTTVARELRVEYLVSGSIRRGGDRVRIAVELAEGPTGRVVWAHRYDRELADLFDVQDEVTQILVATIVGRVEAARLASARRKPTSSLAAFDCLLRGRDHHHRWTLEDNARAIDAFERAIELDSAYALPYAWLGCALGQRNVFERDPTCLERAYQLVLKALALDDDESECHRMLAAYHIARRQLDQAEVHQVRALTLNPNDDRIVCQNGELLTYLGRPVEGAAWIRAAMRLNPYHPDAYWADLGRALLHAGEPEQALHALQRIAAPTPRQLATLIASAHHAGRPETAALLRDRLHRAHPDWTVERLVAPLPYRRESDAETLAEALRATEIPPR